MIVMDVELKSAFGPHRDTNLCRLEIVNDGSGTHTRGNYNVRLFARGHGRLIRTARVENYPRERLPAWRLVAEAFSALDNDNAVC